MFTKTLFQVRLLLGVLQKFNPNQPKYDRGGPLLHNRQIEFSLMGVDPRMHFGGL
ncbi:hypothetical protein PM082_017930 [Marasmius tenuissimus]|nr:hypothetical protein PM082_017930 [Marasmius tenuissimus]